MKSISRGVSILVMAASVLVVTACATPVPGAAPDAPDGQSLGSLAPAPPEGEVVAQGTVMDVDGDVELCLGAVAESYPPQCSGIPVTGWSWDGIDGAETSGETTWGAYAVQGTYDGESFTSTQPPIMLALYDPMPIEDATDQGAGKGAESQLLEIQEELPEILGASYLSSYPENGRLFVSVLWDDGTWQDAADDDYGVDVVVIEPALRLIEG